MTANDPTPGANTPVALPAGERGMAMITVLIFSFVFIVGMMAFFTVAGYEANQAEMREHTTRAFFLADGAIERAKAELLQDGRWDDGYAWVNYEGGRYKLTVSDTTWHGQDVTRFYSEGVFGRNKRDVEVFANIVPPGFEIAILALGNIETRGNITLVGQAHANMAIDGSHFQGDGTFDGGYVLKPPPAFTEPDSFPGATYYYVTAQRAPTEELYIKDRNDSTLFTFVGNVTSHAELTWAIDNNRVLTINYNMGNGVPHALDPAAGIFVKSGSDTAVVINFGRGTPGKHDLTNINLSATGSVNETIKPTIINAKFTGATNEDRLNKTFWAGGTIDIGVKATFEPENCFAVIAWEIKKTTATVSLGTATHPALSYVMGDVDWTAGQFTIHGTLIALGNMSFGGGTNLNYNRNFIACLPPALRLNWPIGTSGEMKVLEWREPPPKPIS